MIERNVKNESIFLKQDSEYNSLAENVIIDYFDKILISYIDPTSENNKGCGFCLLERFINTRKDRSFVKNPNLNDNYKMDSPFENLAYLLIENLKRDKKLVDKYKRRKYYVIDKNNYSISSGYFNPIPGCEVCGCLPDDSRELILQMGKEMIENIYSKNKIPYRATDKKNIFDKLEKLVLNKDVGIVTTLMDSLDGPFPTSVAILPVENGKDESGVGRTDDIADSRAVALFEAIERYAGFMPRGKNTKIIDSYNNLKNNFDDEVIDIKKIILHEDSLSNDSEYKNDFFRFNYKLEHHWVYGYDLSRKRPILLPETLAYYGMRLKDKSYVKESFVYEISNGCAVGSSLIESSYYGLMEVIERDAFLTSWYMNRKIKKIILDEDFMSSNHIVKKEIVKFCEFYKEFYIDIYDITSDTKVPVILVTVTRKNVNKTKLNFMCAAAADVDIFIAIEKALHEVSSIFLGFEEKFEKDYNEIIEKGENLTKVVDMLDHSLIYGYYKNLDKIVFEKQVFEKYYISDLVSDYKKSLNNAYEEILDNLRKIKKDVIVVDQTTEEMKKIGLFCTKTFALGLLPMTFDSKNVRISDERVKDIEYHDNKKLRLRYIPHPFP
ncbi:YcaO-like family protein [Streptococcus pseudoporcinus]|uniref:YcaO-like family protein n=1 Tax=Streptococcus pseudoporcinus TaxID=361101 RepID=A0A4U9YQR6_9STRE|nr:YcaO-like family protein [Streptococcus pseudoporcinus]VTS29940.1 YcaO-like family protein [Streptococcus pseudoporcinus]